MNNEILDYIEEYTFLNREDLIVLSVAGSHLYGTNTSHSDIDYLGVYLPTKRQILLNDYPKQTSLPKKTGFDCQIWSIHYFLKLACQGETMAIDLLHAPDNCIVYMNREIWNDIRYKRKTFYTKNMKSFISYARKQAAKYGMKGERIESIEKVINFLKTKDPDMKLKEIWSELPMGDHIHFLENDNINMYQVAGKKFQDTVKVSYILNAIEKHMKEYGKRAILAKQNSGIDWKAISHALRAGFQVHSILKHGGYSYPLKRADFIRNAKLGKLDFLETIQPIFNNLMDEIELRIEKSNLPEKVDKGFWDNWVIELMENKVL